MSDYRSRAEVQRVERGGVGMRDPKVVKIANTRDGWAIGLIERFEWETGAHYDYVVIRINPRNEYLAISSHKNLSKARAAANAAWISDSEVAA